MARSKLDEKLRNQLQDLNQVAISLEDKAGKLAKGKWVEVTSDFNGQPFGRSKKSLRGKQFQVRTVILDRHGVTLWIGKELLACRITDVRFMDTEPKSHGE